MFLVYPRLPPVGEAGAERLMRGVQLSHCPSPLFRPAYRRTPSPKGEGKNRRLRPSAKCPPRAPRRAGWRRTPYRSKQLRKRGKITLFPFFPYEHTDGGECGAHKKRTCPENKQGSRKSQQSEIFGKEERQAQRARRQTKRAACHGALTRRAAEGRNRRQYAAQFCAATHGRFPP